MMITQDCRGLTTVKEVMSLHEVKEKYPEVYESILINRREYNTLYDWWDFIYEDAKRDGEDMGFSIDSIEFSANRAAWRGLVDINKFLDYHLNRCACGDNNPDTIMTYAGLGLVGWLQVREWLKREGGAELCDVTFTHRQIMCVEDCRLSADSMYEDPKYESLLEGLDKDALEILGILSGWVEEEVDKFTHDLHLRLESEYEHLTSEGFVLDTFHDQQLVVEVSTDGDGRTIGFDIKEA